jgi:hypothetical protein
MRLTVKAEEIFLCPICGAGYYLEEDPGGNVVVVPHWFSDQDWFCPHLDPEIPPVASPEGDAWEVYFYDKEVGDDG